MLRESSRVAGNDVDLQVITAGNEVHGNVPAEGELLAFAEAALGDDRGAITVARSALREKIGTQGMVDAAAVIANFQRMVRIADGTGIPLDAPVAMITIGIRDKLGINAFASAENTPAPGVLQRLLSFIITPLLPFIFRRMAKKQDE